MSAVSESMNRRMTLGLLASRYGFDLDPTFATEVTITSIADDIDSVRPGALFMPSMQVDEQQLRQVQALGAYGAVVPHALRGKTDGVQIPLIYAEPTAQQLGKLASEMAGSPSDSLAVFAVAGNDAQAVDQGVRDLADFLHMLGNPVGVISSGNSQSLERYLDLNYPLSILDVQRTMAVCAEDGAAAVILALSEETLKDDALQSVSVDVLGCGDNGLGEAEMYRRKADPYRRPYAGIRCARIASGSGIRADEQQRIVAVHIDGACGGCTQGQYQKRVARIPRSELVSIRTDT